MKNKGIIVYIFAANKFGNKSVNKVYLLLGGNQGNTVAVFEQTFQLLEQQVGTITQYSPLFETAAWGKTDQPNFLNQAVELTVALTATEVLQYILKIELLLGRQRTEHWGQRIIDIDILFFNKEIINTKQLIVPHPEVQNRRFALVPLQAIAPGLWHPVLHRSVDQLLQDCPDQLAVLLYKTSS